MFNLDNFNMKTQMNIMLALLLVCFSTSCKKDKIDGDIEYPNNSVFNANARVPAEWELHGATWMQWATDYEASMRPAFAQIIKIVKEYEPMHLITSSETAKTKAITYLTSKGVTQTNITWHIMKTDNSWMRDNGPIYLSDGAKTWVQNWKFDGWGSGFGNVPSDNDNLIPSQVASYLGLEVENRQDYVLEKGNVEVNGNGILVINWDCQKDRNPNVTQDYQETLLKNALGVSKVIWAYGHYNGDGTIGHIDGTARFVDENTIAVADYGSDLENNLAQACRVAGLKVVMYPGDVNWLVGNGFVLAMGEGNSNDSVLEAKLKELWPNHKIHLIDGSNIVNLGGGIHCVTNDQPVLP